MGKAEYEHLLTEMSVRSRAPGNLRTEAPTAAEDRGEARRRAWLDPRSSDT